MEFCAQKVMEDVTQWIADWFAANGPDCNAVVGISGGKDSSITAALCARALGKDRVIGVLMPNGEQSDIAVARDLVATLGIKNVEINLRSAYDALCNEIETKIGGMSHQAIVNLPPRLRMSTLYAVSQTFNGRVANTCNLSEDWVGYSTRYGDSVGDFSPLSNLTVAEVKEIARCAGLPDRFIDKVPSDGLCGKTDEDNLGFTYATLDRYIRTGVCEDEQTKQAIDRRHKANLFKLRLMDSFPYDAPRKAED